MTTSPSAKSTYQNSRHRIPAKSIFSDPWCFLAFGLGSGLSPVAPGTLGTVAAIPIYYLMANLSLPLYCGITLGLFLIGITICQRCEQRLNISDHGGIVWDEIVGFLVTMIAAPLSWTAIGLGFIFFRLFDILKPWPIKWLDRHVHGGLGVMLDDAIAGVFAALCLQGVLLFVPSLTP